MKNQTLVLLLFISVFCNIAIARVPPEGQDNHNKVKACLIHGKLYQVVSRYTQCITSNQFYDKIEYNYDHNLYNLSMQDGFYLRFFELDEIAPDPRVNPEFYHGNYELKDINPHDPDCFEDEFIY